VLFPYLLFFIIIGLFILGDKKKEGFKEGKTAASSWLTSEKHPQGDKGGGKGEDTGGGDPCASAIIVKECSSAPVPNKNNCGTLASGEPKRCMRAGNVHIPCEWSAGVNGPIGSCEPLGKCMGTDSTDNIAGKACSGNGKCSYDPGAGRYDCNCKCGWYGEFCEQIGCRETQCGGKTKEEKKSNLAACKKLTAGREKAAAAAKK
jgi:hypothetical protein